MNFIKFRFPKSVNIRIKWLNACGLTTNDDVSRTCLCSRHFKNEDICQSNIFGSVKSSIKRNAVPTLYLKDSLTINNSNESPSETSISELTNENGVANRSLSFFSDSNIVDDNNVLDIMEKSKEMMFSYEL